MANWYAVKTFYRSKADGRPERPDRFYDPDAVLVEERTLLIRAAGRVEALKKAERDAEDYARRIKYKNPYGQDVSMKYLGLYDICELSESLVDKTELFVSSHIMSCHVNDQKIAHAYIPRPDPDLMQSKRKKFLNAEVARQL